MPTIMWFRRDLRLADNPALLAAIEEARQGDDPRVVPLFVIDPVLWDPAGPVRQAYLVDSLNALGASIDRNLLIRHGDPRTVVPEVAAASGATSVHIAADHGRYGASRDAAVEAALTVPLVRTGSPYAVAPGRVTKDDGSPYRVYTPFWRAWVRHGWRQPAPAPPSDVEWWEAVPCQGRPDRPDLGDLVLPPAGEQAARDRWEAFRADGLAEYADLRNRADLAGTSSMSHHLKWGEIHPRTMLADLTAGDEVFGKELAWREFYADVLAQNPTSTTRSLDERFDTRMPWTTGEQADELFAAWAEGRTGYPFVDAGMRQEGICPKGADRQWINDLISDNEVRVKFLDEQDILELGWIDDLIDKFVFGNKYTLHPYYDYRFDKRENLVRIYEVTTKRPYDEIFRGNIKNKSELKKIMQMLNIK